MLKNVILKIKNSKIIKNSFWLVLSTVIQMIISLVINMFVARYLGAANYGILNYGLSFVNFFLGVCTLGLDSIIIKYLVSEKDNQGKVLGTSIVMRLLSSLLAIILIFLSVFVLKHNDKLIIITTFIYIV